MRSRFIPVVGPLCDPISDGAVAFTPGEARRYCAGVLALVAAADGLFYRERPGISVAIFGVVCLAVLAWNRRGAPWDRYRWAAVLLVVPALVQSVVATSLPNLAALLGLFSLAMVDEPARACGARFAAPALAVDCWVRALGRWRTYGRAWEAAAGGRACTDSAAGRAARGAGLALPAAALLVPFAWLLGSGNTIIGEYFSRFAAWLATLKLPSPGHWAFWAVMATGAMTFLAPAVRARAGTAWITPWPAFPVPANARAARWRTWLMLGAVNALFLWANTLDALYLWVHAALPAGLSYSEFVHRGVASLSAATVLSGITLAAIFQQDRSVSRHRATVALALTWIAQNLALLASVGLRLRLYVETYDLTVARLGVASFLVLVAAGFALLARYVVAGKSLNWLLLSNAFAVVGLFYVLQFVDFAGIVARHNVRHWLAHERARIDVTYLVRLGPSAWPSLQRLATDAPEPAVKRQAAQALERARRAAERDAGWQSWQWREAALRRKVFPR